MRRRSSREEVFQTQQHGARGKPSIGKEEHPGVHIQSDACSAPLEQQLTTIRGEEAESLMAFSAFGPGEPDQAFPVRQVLDKYLVPHPETPGERTGNTKEVSEERRY